MGVYRTEFLRILITIVLLSLAAPLPAAAQEAEPQQSQQPGAVPEAAAQPPPSEGPKVQRSSSGVIVIRSSSEATQAERRAAEEKAAADKKAATEGAKAPQAEPPAAKPPRARDVKSYSYTPDGNRVVQTTRDVERRSNSTVENVQRLRNIHGRDVPYLASEEQVVSETPGKKTVERRTQRYDTEGRPTRQQLVREQERTLPDGSVERIATTYEEDLDGNMQPVERKVTREKKAGDTTRTVMTAERTSPGGGGFQPYLHEESVETRQGEEAARIEKIVKRPDQSGQLQEWSREQTVMSKSGNTSTTETQVWERSTLTGKVMLSERKVGKLVERPDGSANETVETYALSAEGSAIDVNAGGRPRLAQTVTRESKVKPNGETVVTTATQSRSIADPSQMGPQALVQEVSRPTAGGQAVETTVYERGVNGRMLPTEVTVEQIQK